MSHGGEYCWVRVGIPAGAGDVKWKLARGQTCYGMLSKWARHWVVSNYDNGELLAKLPRTLNTDDAKAAAKLILLSLKEKE